MASNRELALEDLLLVEDDEAIPEFHCAQTQLPLWPQIRIAFFRMLMSDLFYGTPLTGTSTIRVPKGRAAVTMARSVVRNLGLRMTGRCRADICMMTEGVANQWIDGKWLNRLADHFALVCANKTLMVEDHFEWRWPFPRHHQRTMFHAPLQARNAILGKLHAKPSDFDRAQRLVDLITQRSQRLLGWAPGPEREQRLVGMLARKSASLPSQFLGYQTMLGRIRPKLLLVGAACYGPSAALIAAARDAGVVTAEYQHGAISGGHDAYNFAPAIRCSNLYRRTLPHYFLGYGTWWNDQINAPVTKIAIGNPHRQARLSQAAATPGIRSKEEILILSDGIEFELYLDLARQIAPLAAKKGLRVVVRPHPLERSSVAARHGAQVDGIGIDASVDLYVSLRTAHAVVSEVSTGLFDAAGVADKLFMWNTAKSRFGFPVHPFQSFATAEVLLDLLDQDHCGRLDESQLDAIWAPHWRRNYVDFVGAHGVACAA